MPIYSSDSDDTTPPKKFFANQKPLHAILGGGKAADTILWRNSKLSGAILIGATAIWSLFEVGEYNLVTLACHIAISTMLILFVWSSASGFIDWNPPNPKAITIQESTVNWVIREINRILLRFYHVSSGKDLRTFFVVISFLWVLSGIGNYFSTLNMLYFVFLGAMSLPALYERYESEVDYLAIKGNRDMRKLYRKIDHNILNKIPRGPIKEKKRS